MLRASVARPELGLPTADTVAQLGAGHADELVHAARFHGIAGYVLRVLRQSGGAAGAGEQGPVHAAVVDALRQEVQRSVARHLTTLADLDHVTRALAGVTPWLVLKGPVLAETVHDGPELRAYADLDVLVPPERFGPALEALEAAGGQTLDRNWTLLARELKGEVHVRLPLGTVVDLHWTVFNERAVRERYPIATEHLFERCREVAIRGRRVLTLDEADSCVYVGLHALLSGGHRLLWLKDLERLMTQAGEPPAALAARARAWNAALPFSCALTRTRAAIGFPEHVRTTDGLGLGLSERAWMAGSAAVWRQQPAEREDGVGSLARMVARSVQPTAAASLRVLGGKLRTHVAGRLRGKPRQPPDPDSPGSGRYDSGGPTGRVAYLDAVARQARPRRGCVRR
jgi:hypothetical protein